MIPFDKLNPELVEVLKTEGITEEDLKRYHSDLYIGCRTPEQFHNIKQGGNWRSMASGFISQIEEDRKKYYRMLEIPFAAMQVDFEAKKFHYHKKENKPE